MVAYPSFIIQWVSLVFQRGSIKLGFRGTVCYPLLLALLLIFPTVPPQRFVRLQFLFQSIWFPSCHYSGPVYIGLHYIQFSPFFQPFFPLPNMAGFWIFHKICIGRFQSWHKSVYSDDVHSFLKRYSARCDEIHLLFWPYHIKTHAIDLRRSLFLMHSV